MTYERLAMGITTRLYDTEAEDSGDGVYSCRPELNDILLVISRPAKVSHLCRPAKRKKVDDGSK